MVACLVVPVVDARGSSSGQKTSSTLMVVLDICNATHAIKIGESLSSPSEAGQGVVTRRHCVSRAQTHRLSNQALGAWKKAKRADNSGYSSQRVCTSKLCTSFCQTSLRSKHIHRTPTQTSASHSHLDHGRPRSTRRPPRGLCVELIPRPTSAHIPPTKPSTAPAFYPRPCARRSMRLGSLPLPPHPPTQRRKAQAQATSCAWARIESRRG